MPDEQDILRQHLRTATREAHHRIDHHALMMPLVRGRMSTAGYGNILLALYSLHAPVEQALLAWPVRPGATLRQRSRWLAADLDQLGRSSDLDRPDLPRWTGQPPTCASSYFGMRYVIEGSALGGRVIQAQLRPRITEHCWPATRFFQGDPDGQDWQQFWQLAANPACRIDADTAAAAAVRLFADIEQLWDAHVRWHNAGLPAGRCLAG